MIFNIFVPSESVEKTSWSDGWCADFDLKGAIVLTNGGESYKNKKEIARVQFFSLKNFEIALSTNLYNL